MDAESKKDFEAANLNLCRRGERVLALCELPLDPTKCNAQTAFEYDRDEPQKTNFPLDGTISYFLHLILLCSFCFRTSSQL
jgi:hypothetical protein